MSVACHLYALLFYLYVLVCHSYVSRMYLYVICMSLVCAPMSFIRMSLVCHPYVTHMYSYVIRVSLVCTRISSVCHSYVLVCYPYVTCMWFYYEPFHSDTFWNNLLLNMAVWWGQIQWGDKAETRGTDEQPFSDKPSLIQYGETYNAW